MAQHLHVFMFLVVLGLSCLTHAAQRRENKEDTRKGLPDRVVSKRGNPCSLRANELDATRRIRESMAGDTRMRAEIAFHRAEMEMLLNCNARTIQAMAANMRTNNDEKRSQQRKEKVDEYFNMPGIKRAAGVRRL